MRVAIINGPNLNLLGSRQPEIYGTMTLADLEEEVREWSSKLDVEPSFFQSNDESELVSQIQRSGKECDALVLNPGGFTHTSVAIADAVASISAPVVEVHLSDIATREAFRRISLVAPNAVRQISGRGAIGYRDAIRHLVFRDLVPFTNVRYGPHPRNVADHRVADGDSLVVLVHGGYWFSGWDRDQLDQAAVDLTRRGYDTLNMEYRVDPPWPGSGHDVRTALAWARDRYHSVSLLGHSAGAFLALWAHLRNPVDVCVGLAPVTDLSMVDDVSSTQVLIAAGGPTAMTIPGRTVLFHGTDDTEVSPDHTSRSGQAAEIHLLDGVGHFDILDPQRPHWAAVVSALGGTPGDKSELPPVEKSR
ncbi:MAG: type II 3-dehydroquinate dehydratase [Acidimicrobiia bacterium]